MAAKRKATKKANDAKQDQPKLNMQSRLQDEEEKLLKSLDI